MATITGQNITYVLKTPDEAITTDSSNSRQLVLINNPIIVCPNNAPEPVRASHFYQNRKELNGAKNVPMKRLFNSKCYGGRKKIAQNHPLNQEPVILNPTLPTPRPRKKLCYETEFKPAVPSTSGSFKGFIRYGKRQLIVDQQIFINPKQFKHQLNYTNDLFSTSGMAPRSKQEMHRLLNGITKIFAHPAHKMFNAELLDLYVSKCTYKESPNVETYTDMELLPLGYHSQENTTVKIQKQKYMKSQKDKKSVQLIKEILEKAAKSANDHQYIKEVNEDIQEIEQINLNTEESIPSNAEDEHEVITIHSEELKTEIEVETNNVFTMKSDELYTLKSEDENDERQIVIIQRLGENIALSQNNLEILLAAANGSDQSNEVVAIFTDDGSGFISVKDENEEILGTDSEVIIN